MENSGVCLWMCVMEVQGVGMGGGEVGFGV